MPPAKTNTGVAKGLTYVESSDGKFSFTSKNGKEFYIEYDTSNTCCERLTWKTKGKFNKNAIWNIKWKFNNETPEDEDDAGGRIVITFTSNKNKVVTFEWSNYHNGYYSHKICINGNWYVA